MPPIETIEDKETLRQVALLLQKENERLHGMIEELTQRLALLTGTDAAKQIEVEIERLRAHMAKLQKAAFGKTSEKRPGAMPKETGAKLPRTGHGPREQKALPVVEVTHEIPAEEMVCDLCGNQLREWEGQYEESEEISVVQRRFVIKKHKRKKARCTCGACVKTAPAPAKLIEGGRYSAEFAIEVATQKYQDHLPLERQVRIMAREGLKVDSQTLWDQVWALACLLEPAYDKLLGHVKSQRLLLADETPVYLLKKGGKAKWYAWALATADAVYFHVDPSRGADVARRLLDGYRGSVISDGYIVYASLDGKPAPNTDIIWASCWSHSRRKYVECEQYYPKEVEQILELIRELYKVEEAAPDPWAFAEGPARESAATTRKRLRNELSRSLVASIEKWATEQRLLPGSTLRDAIEYMNDHWKGLQVFLDDPYVPLDTNSVERLIRAIAVGRKNFYGIKSERGGKAAAIFYSLCGTAKQVGVDPKAYLFALTNVALEGNFEKFLPRDLVPQDTDPPNAPAEAGAQPTTQG
jgi:transposase